MFGWLKKATETINPPDVYGIFHEYFFDTKTEKCWWNKYKLTIHF